ncbi:MAG: LamG domain-containing protein, partial [Saprospiraceae bacterium]
GCPPGTELIVNGNLEEGTEVKQLGVYETVDAATMEQAQLREGKMRAGTHFADGQPYCYMSNSWGPYGSGEKIKDSWIICNGTTYKSSAGSPVTSIPGPFSAPTSSGGLGERFKNLAGPYNYFNLCNDVQNCHRYVLEFDYYSTLGAGAVVPIVVGFTNNATFPTTASLTYSFVHTIAAVGATWTRVSIPFTYCGTAPASILDLQQLTASYFLGFLVDNLSLIEDVSPAPPLIATISPSNPTIPVGGSVVLTANTTNALCNLTYTWLPGNLSTPSISVTPTGTTIYMLTVSDGCRSTTATTTVTVKADSCGIANNCLDFDGANDQVNVPSPLPSGVDPGPFTVACWFRDDRTTATGDYRIASWNGPGSRFEIMTSSGGFLAFYNNGSGLVTSTINVRDGRWHYVAAVRSGTGVSFYYDGLPVTSLNPTGVSFPTFPANFVIGNYAGSSPSYWKGRIDEFKIWKIALNPTEVVDAMLCSADPNTLDLVLHFPFNEKMASGINTGFGGNIATNKAGTGVVYNGTLLNFTLNTGASNWVARGISQLPACLVAPFAFLEGNTGINTAYRTKIYNGDIYSLSLERTAGSSITKPAFIRRTSSGTIVWRTVLDFGGIFNDFVLTEDGCAFLLVGETRGTLPDLINNKSFVACISNASSSPGALTWKHTFTVNSGYEAFTRIILSNNPAN